MAKITTDTVPPKKTYKVGRSKDNIGTLVIAILVVASIFWLINHFAS